MGCASSAPEKETDGAPQPKWLAPDGRQLADVYLEQCGSLREKERQSINRAMLSSRIEADRGDELEDDEEAARSVLSSESVARSQSGALQRCNESLSRSSSAATPPNGVLKRTPSQRSASTCAEAAMRREARRRRRQLEEEEELALVLAMSASEAEEVARTLSEPIAIEDATAIALAQAELDRQNAADGPVIGKPAALVPTDSFARRSACETILEAVEPAVESADAAESSAAAAADELHGPPHRVTSPDMSMLPAEFSEAELAAWQRIQAHLALQRSISMPGTRMSHGHAAELAGPTGGLPDIDSSFSPQALSLSDRDSHSETSFKRKSGSSASSGKPEADAGGSLATSSDAHSEHTQQSPARCSDEEVARQLQRQLDLEAETASQGRESGQEGQNAAPSAPRLPSLPASRSRPGNLPSWPPATADPHLCTQPPAPVPPLQVGGAAVGISDANTCGGCNKPLRRWQDSATAGGRRYHTSCLKCAHCSQGFQAGPGTVFAVGKDARIYHVDCHKQHFHPKCSVCREFLPQEANGLVRYHHNPFWGNKFCPRHEKDNTPRCTACNRLQPGGEEWVATDEGRHTCLECLHTLVRNTDDAQPLYDDVLALYAHLAMPLPTRPPLLLVESAALNEAGKRDSHEHREDGPVFHTRGLTLSEEHRSIRTVASSRRDAGKLLNIVPSFNRVESSRWEVTALLVLFGLPWLLTGSILAHEVMHAYLRLAGFQPLSMDVEEGLAQLMALLWLERQTPAPGSYEERLASYLGHQIRTDPSHVYGEGFRAAHDAFQRHGLPAVLAHVRRAGTLPP